MFFDESLQLFINLSCWSCFSKSKVIVMSIYRKILSNNICKLICNYRNSFYLISIYFKFRLIFFIFIFISIFLFFFRFLFNSFFFLSFFSCCSCCCFFFLLSFLFCFINLLLSFNQSLNIRIISIQSSFKLWSKTLPACFKLLQWFLFKLDSIIVWL